jgi:hypothetical protein
VREEEVRKILDAMQGRTSDDVTWRGWLALLAAAVVVQPFVSLFVAWTLTVEWRWFLAEQYGPGPSLMSWFGLSLIAGLIIGVATVSVARKPGHDKPRNAIASMVGVGFGAALVLGIAWLYRALLWGAP